MSEKMNSFQRVMTTLSFKEPDRVPLFLMVTMHGAKELGMSLNEYFSSSGNVVEGQLRLIKKYRSDCLYPFFYAALEVEAWGGEVMFFEDGPPNAGTPFIQSYNQIKNLKPPQIKNNPVLQKSIQAIARLKKIVKDEVPILGIVMSPFSLPVMQLGFDRYLELIYNYPDEFEKLMVVNMEFCIDWANSQLEAGATAIGYFDPVSSPTIIDKETYLKTGFKIATQTIKKIKGATAIHLASGRVLPVIKELIETGTTTIGVSCLEDIEQIKKACFGKLTVLGNLNGIEMRRWSATYAEAQVKQLIKQAAPGGGFILSDNHGEIPFQVSDEILLSISEAVHKWGNYPISNF